ncbi:MAG: hypothetical protein ABSF50_09305 [Burkholderiaceae bacterium]
MNPHPSNEEHDGRIGALYRLGATEEPSSEHDAFVLGRAASALEPKAATRPRWFQFRRPMALAAVLAVAASLYLFWTQQTHSPEGSMQALNEPPPAGPTRSAESSTASEPRLDTAASSAAAPPSAAVTTSPSPATGSDQGSLEDKLKARGPTAPEQALSPATAARAKAEQSAGLPNVGRKRDLPSPARALTQGTEEPAPTQPPEIASALGGARATAPTAQAMPAPAAPAPQASLAMRAAPRMAAPSALTPAPEAPDALARRPEQWIEEIRALHRLGRDSEALASLRSFKARYPGYRLPEDLQALP